MRITYDNVLEPARQRMVGVEASAAWSALAGTINDCKALLRRKAKEKGNLEYTTADTELVIRLKNQLKEYSQEVQTFVDIRIKKQEEEAKLHPELDLRDPKALLALPGVAQHMVNYFRSNPNAAIGKCQTMTIILLLKTLCFPKEHEYASLDALRDTLTDKGVESS